MPVKTTLKSRILDKKDKEILMLLQENSRESLTNIAKKVNLSIDAVNKRIKEMQRKNLFEFSVVIDPHALGFELIADVKIKLKNITEKDRASFIAYLSEHPRVIDLFGIMGDFDLTCVIIAKNGDELDKLTTEIRQKYSKIISDWKSVLVLKTYKLEKYDLF
ncbi:hypothetical protein COV18_02840 [Candidatus Woesearchaeota archaeon CG10_big_fil_rev_8_21_14_0_10_37_12]|nr:MAG: hypothetical protein COV18_02840 [Candidatus Woesearchaeota archaeon CG10_big_fil_rev_8_21_14_0_10_37_12]